MKEWYDGYSFWNYEIYNPWSLLKYVLKAVQDKPSPESFWANTSKNDIVFDYISRGGSTLRNELDLLISGKTVRKNINPELTYREMDDIDNIYSFLLFTGYLKITKTYTLNEYELAIPNNEVKEIYTRIFQRWFEDCIEASSQDFLVALLNKDEERAMDILDELLSKSISYYDNNEGFYHGLLAGLLTTDYAIKSNRGLGLGRPNLLLLPSSERKNVIIIECKKANQLIDLEKKCDEALIQIKERKYMEGANAEGYRHVLACGISFFKKTCCLKFIK